MKEKKSNNKRKLKLCLIGDASNIHTQKHANYFVDLGHEVHLVDDHTHKYKNLKFHLIKNFTGIRIIDYLLRIIQSIIIIRKIKPDIVHSLQVTYHGFIGALSGIHPFILTPWGSDILFVPNYSFFHKAITNFTIFRADIIHCIDVSVLNRLKQMYGNKINKKNIFNLNEGVNTKIFSPAKRKPDKNISVLCLRALRESYGPMLLIEALNILINKKNQHNIKVFMLRDGEKKYKKRIHDKIKEYKLSKYIKFYEWVNNKTQDYMKMADIYVDTIYRPTQGQGTGKTMLEAMSSQLAVVAPDNPSIELYVKHKANGIIYKGNNLTSLANAVQLLVKNKKLRLKVGKSARNFILKNLNQKINMKLMEKKYYELVK